MHEQRIVAPAETKIVVHGNEPVERPFAYHFFYRVERKRKSLLSRLHNMDYVAQVSCIGAPAFGPLFVRKNLDKREIVYRCRMSAHFEPRIEQVVLLVGINRAFLDFFKFQIVSALFANLWNRHNAEFKAACLRVILYDLFPEP